MLVKAPDPEFGTPVAFIDYNQGCASTRKIYKWGGARNFKGRTSWYLSLAQCLRIIAAADRADAIGLRFNRHWTIHYQNAGVSEENASKFIGHILKLAREYATRHGEQFACLWVRENGPRQGGHVHLLMHIPADLSLRGRSRKWIGLAGGKCRKKVSHIRPVGGSLNAADAGGPHYECNARIVREYLLKGADPAAGEFLHLAKFGQRGFVLGKRVGFTQNLSGAKLQRERSK